MPIENLMVLYVNKELHKKIKLYCIRHNIKTIQGFIEPLLEAAITKPQGKERLEKAAEELTQEERDLIDKETELATGYTTNAPELGVKNPRDLPRDLQKVSGQIAILDS